MARATIAGGLARLQSFPADPSLFAVAGTFLLATITVGVTAHVAVRYVRGGADPTSAVLAGPPPAAVLVLGVALALETYLWLALFVVVAPLVLWEVYDLDRRETAIAAVVQYTMLIGIGSIATSLLG